MAISDFMVDGKWGCIKCGACCKLGSYPIELLKKMRMMSYVGDDGWCVKYDKATRLCTIHEDRPLACQDDPETLNLYGDSGIAEFCDIKRSEVFSEE